MTQDAARLPEQYSQRAQGERRKSSGIAVGRRFAILQRHNFHCQYCGEEASCVDHIVPWSYGGSDSDDNLVAACHICNLVATGKVFDSIDEKRSYILERRHERKASGRDDRRNRVAVCPCGSPFQPNVDGSSNVLCGPCYFTATLTRETRPLRDVRPPYASHPTGDARAVSPQVQIIRVKLGVARACEESRSCRVCGTSFMPAENGFLAYCSRACKDVQKQRDREAQ